MDKWGDHALVCSCGGDRVIRHNMIRDVVHSAANNKAGLGAILEKPGLLIPRDPLDSDRPPDPDPPDPSSPSRRPADVWVPRGPGGAPRRGTSRSRVPSGSDRPPRIRQPSLVFSPLLRPAREFSSTPLRNAHAQASTSAPSLSRRSEGDGPRPSVLSCHGSRVKVTATPPLVIPILVSRSRSASHAPFTGKTRARS